MIIVGDYSRIFTAKYQGETLSNSLISLPISSRGESVSVLAIFVISAWVPISLSDQKVRQASPFTAGKDSTAGGAGSLEFSTEKRVLRFHFCCAIRMYGNGKNQANTLGRGAPEVAFGEDVRPEAIPATSMN